MKNYTILWALAVSLAFAGCHKKKQPDYAWDAPTSQNQNQYPYPPQQYAPQHYDNSSSWLPYYLMMNQANNRPNVVYREAPSPAPEPSHSYSPPPSPPSGSRSYSSHGSAYSAPKAAPAPSRSYSSGGRSYSSPSRSSGSSRSYSGSGGRSYSRGR